MREIASNGLAGFPGRAVEPLERVEREPVGVVEREGRPPRGDRLARAVERLLVQRGDPLEQDPALPGIVGQLGPARHHLDQLWLAPLRLEQAVEPGQRLRVVLARLEQPAESRDRGRPVFPVPLVDVGDAAQGAGDAIEVVLLRDAALEGGDQLVPRAQPPGQRHQHLEHLVVARVLQPGARQCIEREAEVAAPALVQVGDLAQHRDPPGRLFRVFQLRAEDDDQLPPPVLGPVDRLQDAGDALLVLLLDHEALEGAQRGRLGLHLQHLLVLIDRALDVGQPALEQVGQTEAERHGQLRVRRPLDAPDQELGPLEPLLLRLEQPLQLALGRRVVRIDVERRPVAVHRAGQVAQPVLVDPGHAAVEVEAPARVGRGPHRLLVDLDERVPALRPGQHRLEAGEGLVVARAGLEDPPVGGVRALDLAEPPLGQLGQGQRDVAHDRSLTRHVVEQLLVQVGQAGPAVEHAGQPDQLGAEARIVRVLAQETPVPAERAIHVLELVLVQPGDVALELHALFRRAGGLELDLVDADQTRPVLTRDVDRLEHVGRRGARAGVVEIALERLARTGVARVAAERGAVVLHRPLRVVEVGLAQLTEAEAKPDRLLDREGEAEPALGQVGQVVPPLGLLVEELERLGRAARVRDELEDLLPGHDRVDRTGQLVLGCGATDLRRTRPARSSGRPR